MRHLWRHCWRAPVLLAALLLVACAPRTDSRLSLHDIALYNLDGNFLYGYFYGSPRNLTTSAGRLTLSEGRAEGNLAVSGALLVNDQPHLRERLDPIAPPFEVSRAAFSTDLRLRSQADMGTIVYFDGSLWFTLSESANAGFNTRVVPRERPSGLRGLGQLSSDEARTLQRKLEQRAAPLAVGVLPQAPSIRSISGIDEHRRTALVIQEDISLESGVVTSNVRELPWTTIASGNQAAIGQGRQFFIATSRTQLVRLWNQAYGSLLSPPPVPEVDFSRESIIAVFLGSQPTGGYGLSVRELTLENNDIYVNLDISEPAADAITTQAITSPWLMLRVSRPGLNVVWFRDARLRDLIGVARREF